MQKSRAEYQRKWRAANPDKVKQHNQTSSERKKQWWSDNRERILPEKRAKWKAKYPLNKEKEMKSCRKWQKENPDRVRATKYRWICNNPEKAVACRRAWYKKKYADPFYRLERNLRIRLTQTVSSKRKCATTEALLGCSMESFRIYIESKFEPGMTWGNYGSVWQLDHIMPCAIFDFSNPEHQKRCFHFSNIQPLFSKDNLLKRDVPPENHQFEML